MNPYNLLTKEDKDLFFEYCCQYGDCEPQDLKKILCYWNKNKRTICKAFGNKLRVSFPIEIPSNYMVQKNRLERIYSISYNKNNHPFAREFLLFLSKLRENDKIDYHTECKIIDLIGYASVVHGKTIDNIVVANGRRIIQLLIPQGTKIMRAIRKILEYYNFDRIDLFEKWRDEISLANTFNDVKTNLVFSINPIDYLTMSDNESGWTSCMSWKDGGSYHAGTIEMLNSNMAIVCYLENENKKNYIYNYKKIPNKMYRVLLFAHKDILCVGKQYPYSSDVLSEIILEKAMQLFSSLGWKYQYQYQKYLDMVHIRHNRFIVNNMNRTSEGHRIYLYTGSAMYNDFAESDATIWCCRNYVDKNKFYSISGPLTCMCCGKPMEHDEGLEDIVYCKSCEYDNKCQNCYTISTKQKIEIRVLGMGSNYYMCVCKDCLKYDFWFDKYNGVFVQKNRYNILKDIHKMTLIPVDEEVINEVCGSIYS